MQNQGADDINAANLLQVIEKAGGRMGDLTFTLKWNAPVDLDLHLYCEHGTQIFYGHHECNTCKTKLDIDMQEDREN